VSAPASIVEVDRADRRAALTAVALVAVAVAAGAGLGLAGHPVHASAAPLFGHWQPHAGPGTPVAVAIAAVVCWQGPGLAARLRFRWVLAAGYAATAGWILALALVDGWRRGVTTRLTTPFEYLSEVGPPVALRDFAGRIVEGGPDPWTTHVAGHPPGALLVFAGLDRIGLGGGTWAALACILAGASVTVSVPVTLHVLGRSDAARAAVPFLVLFPGAVWIGVSADGLFAGVAAAGLALLAVGLTRPSAPAAFGSGLVLAAAAYLSYGLILLAPLALVIVVLAPRRERALWTVFGGLVVIAAFTGGGFDWLEGYRLVRIRYYQGLASRRPYGYWVWGNLAALVLCAGPAVAPILRRAAKIQARRADPMPALLVLAAAVAIVAADVSGLSKAETERIWLPFVVWLTAGAVLLPARGRAGWLAVQAVTALLVNHLVLTGW
jgi:hypothetical protein